MAVNTLKFSQFASGGNIVPGSIPVGLNNQLNAKFSVPWAFLPPGSTAQRPPITPSIYYLMRLNTDTQLYEYYNPVSFLWIQVSASTPPTTFVWNFITGTSASMVTNNGYIVNNSAQVALLLPTLAAFGDELAVSGYGIGGFKITQNSGQSIIIDPDITTPGSGSIASFTRYCSLRLVCAVADTVWTTTGGIQGYVDVQ